MRQKENKKDISNRNKSNRKSWEELENNKEWECKKKEGRNKNKRKCNNKESENHNRKRVKLFGSVELDL